MRRTGTGNHQQLCNPPNHPRIAPIDRASGGLPPGIDSKERNSYVQVVATLASRDHAHFSSEYMVSEKGDEILSYVLEGYCNESR